MVCPTVYFARAGHDGPIKIGYTGGDPLDRLAELQTGCPWRLSLIGTLEGNTRQEAWLQGRFAAIRLEGEWFEPTGELVALIERMLRPDFVWPEIFVGDGAIRREARWLGPMENVRRKIFVVNQSVFASIAGTTQATVSRWESGEFSPGYRELVLIRQAAFDRGLAWNDSLFFEVPAASAALWAVGQ